jgi:hypothetical protein
MLLQELSIRLPRRFQRFVVVMEKVYVSRDPRSPDELIEGSRTWQMPLAGGDSVLGYEAADASLEVRKRHCRASAALR